MAKKKTQACKKRVKDLEPKPFASQLNSEIKSYAPKNPGPFCWLDLFMAYKYNLMVEKTILIVSNNEKVVPDLLKTRGKFH